MIHAYAENYLIHSRNNLGRMLDVGVNCFLYPLKEFYHLFLESSISWRFAHGEPNIVAGHSGIELAFEVLSAHDLPVPQQEVTIPCERSPEYWTGWALAYYQWRRCWSFQEIDSFVPIESICALYHPYHEMDILKLVEHLDEWYHIAHPESRLKAFRKAAKLSQADLAALSGVPLRTIQQYEQRNKNINASRADALLSLAQTLHCSPTDILEPA